MAALPAEVAKKPETLPAWVAGELKQLMEDHYIKDPPPGSWMSVFSPVMSIAQDADLLGTKKTVAKMFLGNLIKAVTSEVEWKKKDEAYRTLCRRALVEVAKAKSANETVEDIHSQNPKDIYSRWLVAFGTAFEAAAKFTRYADIYQDRSDESPNRHRSDLVRYLIQEVMRAIIDDSVQCAFADTLLNKPARRYDDVSVALLTRVVVGGKKRLRFIKSNFENPNHVVIIVESIIYNIPRENLYLKPVRDHLKKLLKEIEEADTKAKAEESAVLSSSVSLLISSNSAASFSGAPTPQVLVFENSSDKRGRINHSRGAGALIQRHIESGVKVGGSEKNEDGQGISGSQNPHENPPVPPLLISGGPRAGVDERSLQSLVEGGGQPPADPATKPVSRSSGKTRKPGRKQRTESQANSES